MPAEERGLPSGTLRRKARTGMVIGDESRNTGKDSEPSEEALSQGEGGTGLPLLSALRQGLASRHSPACLSAGESQRRRTGSGRSYVRHDRNRGDGRVAVRDREPTA